MRIMKPVNKIYQLILGAILLFSCEDPYTPTYEPGDTAPILIIEGYIDMSGNSRFKLNQTVPLSAEESTRPVTNAVLAIESEDNQNYPVFTSTGAGVYTIAHPALNMTTRYRLRIKHRENEYLSDWITPYATSQISAIDNQRTDIGMDIFVSTVNGNDNSRYYRWELEETWKFSARYRSLFIFEGNQVRWRKQPEENISVCFSQERSSDILIGTTDNLSDNTISRQKIQFIPNLSDKLMIRYSILVKQFSISREAYLFWSILKKNSESVGDIFGSMPSELKGNVSNIANPDEPVIAMIEASLPAQKRIYYNSYDLPEPWAVSIPFYSGCEYMEVPVAQAAELFKNAGYIPTNEVYKIEGSALPSHYSYATRRCTDCSLIGSLNVPDFWTDL